MFFLECAYIGVWLSPLFPESFLLRLGTPSTHLLSFPHFSLSHFVSIDWPIWGVSNEWNNITWSSVSYFFELTLWSQTISTLRYVSELLSCSVALIMFHSMFFVYSSVDGYQADSSLELYVFFTDYLQFLCRYVLSVLWNISPGVESLPYHFILFHRTFLLCFVVFFHSVFIELGHFIFMLMQR